MSEHFEHAPNMSGDFARSSEPVFEQPLEFDAATWEPIEEEHSELPSEKHLQMHLRPGGMLEQEVHTQIDSEARARIIEAQQREHSASELADEQELDLSGEFDRVRRNEWGWDPESMDEYEAYLQSSRDNIDQNPFNTGRRFERQTEREQGDWEWER